jgi:ubiquinone/menaquinone biosynthesis C-methylase UbiE
VKITLETGERPSLKAKVKEHWERETCGTRYGESSDRKQYFAEISASRYALEPYIPPFADFASALGRSVLEIGVGAGADFENWCEHAEHATGVDLTERGIALSAERLSLKGVAPQRYTLRTADAENLPFADNSFDIVYSWGVLHHSPNTERCFAEAWRVLRPGGQLKAMVYHTPSWTGLMLQLQHGIARGRFGMTMKDALFNHLESPGTKAYTLGEANEFLDRTGYANIRLATKLGPGDTLTINPSGKYQSSFFRLIWRIYPRWLVRGLGDRLGLNLLITATKPVAVN